MSFLKNVLSHPNVKCALKRPFYSYFKIGAKVFGFTTSTNVVVGLFNPTPAINIYQNPQTFAFLAVTKGFWKGLVWPTLPIQIIKAPKDFFVLGESTKRALKEHKSV